MTTPVRGSQNHRMERLTGIPFDKWTRLNGQTAPTAALAQKLGTRAAEWYGDYNAPAGADGTGITADTTLTSADE